MNDIEVAKQLFLRGAELLEGERYAKALICLRQAQVLVPNRPSVLINLAAALIGLGQLDEARDYASLATLLSPDSAEAWLNLGASENSSAALTAYQRSLALHESADAWLGCATTFMTMRRYDEVLPCLHAALKLKPEFAEAWSVRGACLQQLKRTDEALAAYERAMGIRPDWVKGWFNFGNFLQEIKQYPQAAEAFARAYSLKPDAPFALGNLAHSRMLCCDWRGYDETLQGITQALLDRHPVVEPFGYQALSSSASDLRLCAEVFARTRLPTVKAMPSCSVSTGSKIRLGYVSGEFRQQATSILAVELFELHDKSRFEIYAFDSGWDDGSVTRRRIEAAFVEVVDVSRMSDELMFEEIRRREIDILVNLNGHFGLVRSEVFCMRPCPIQVNYLGFPGTFGSDCLDYIIADAWVIPEDHHEFYLEKVVTLPDSYQVNDGKRPIADVRLSRAECGLPQTGFVYCCFNNNYKITPEVFDLWMRILMRVPGSVLWLIEDNPDAAANLRKEAMQRGVASSRLIFAARVSLDMHLARHAAADLFLDTLPYNAHTTASDALWAGLPLLTCLGNTFPGRVAASLLDAVGLRDLITHSFGEYEEMAVLLATSPSAMSELKQRLLKNRQNAPLFNAQRYARHIEATYERMYRRRRDGLLPTPIRVELIV